MRQRLDSKVVMITGAARGIGAETARRAAAKGARVSLVGLEPERLKALADELGDRAAWFEADVTDRDSVVAAAGAVTTELVGHITHGATKEAIEEYYEATAITADDVAQIIAFAVTRPRSVSISESEASRPTSISTKRKSIMIAPV